MKVLLLIPQDISDDRHERVWRGERPEAEYDAVANLIRSAGSSADILHWNLVAQEGGSVARLVHRFLGRNWALAFVGYRRCRAYDAVFAQSEVVGLPFAMLLTAMRRRPRHVMTAHCLEGKRNAVWYRFLRAHSRIDKIFVLGHEQHQTGLRLELDEGKLLLVDACGYIDASFFATAPDREVNARQVCAVGREFRDYKTLIEAVGDLPDIKAKIDPGSPWSLHHNKVGGLSIPPNVEIKNLEMGTVRNLYAESAAVVLPLHVNAIGAGRTTLVEAMAMGKPVIVTMTRDNTYAGRSDIIDDENVLLVKPGDVADLRRAIQRLMGDARLRHRIGSNARQWAERNAGRRQWLDIVWAALGEPAEPPRVSAVAQAQLERGAP